MADPCRTDFDPVDLAMMVLPLPAFILDLLFTFNIPCRSWCCWWRCLPSARLSLLVSDHPVVYHAVASGT